MKFNRSLSEVNDNGLESRQIHLRRTLIEKSDDSNLPIINTSLNIHRIANPRKHLTALDQAGNLQIVKKVLNQDKVKKSLYEPLESDKENLPQIKNIKITKPFKKISQSKDNIPLIVNYSDDILSHFKQKFQNQPARDPLQNHNIPSSLRSKMVDWLVEVTSSYKCTDQTYFLTVKIMDDYLSSTKKNFEIKDIHLTGVTSLFIACKYEEIYSMKLQIVHEKISHRKLTENEIKEKEADILNTLDFEITNATLLDIYRLLLSKLDLQLAPKHQKYLEKLCSYLSKMVLYDYELVRSFNYFQLAGGLIFVAFKVIEQLDQAFNSEFKFKDVLYLLEQENEDLIEVASKILTLAKQFDQIYPNLENLRKFNQFQIEEEE